MGRPVQNVRVGASGSAFDLHTLTEYDQYGRAYRSWLPIEASSAGNYLDSEAIKNTAKVLYSDNRPFTESIAERTPELLDSEVYGVGELWYNADRKKTQKRGINTDDICPRFDVDTEGRLVMNGYYDEGRLRYEEITDENEDFIIYRFYDTEKHLILDTKYNGEDYYDTYYVYNTIGQLTYVIPPKAASELFLADDGVCDTAVVRKLCYHYAYDQYNRLVEKRLPGAEPEYFVYDALDNIVLSQDGNLRRENKWRVQKLDHKYRKSVEGIATLVGETRASLQERWGNDLAIESVQLSNAYMDNLYYSDTCGISNFEPNVSYFYDSYKHWTFFTGMNSVPIDADYTASMDTVTGLLTGKAVWDNTIWKQPVVSAITYDDRKRIITESEIDYDRMYHLTTHHKYNFIGDLIGKKSILVNNDLGETLTSEHSYTYDYSGSLLEVKHRYNGGAWSTLYSLTYDEVKRLSSKTITPRGSPSQSKTIQYGYNIRNWVARINSPVFSQTLRYQDATNGAEPRWGGSPSGMSFTSVNHIGQLDTCSVNYSYDWLDRLIEVSQSTPLGDNPTFNESFAYDENGNPEIITRGNINNNPVQYISLSYDGNHITALNESKPIEGLYPNIPSIAKGDYETDWTYDANGNRTADPSRGISAITYTIHNQPLKITFEDGSYIQHNYRSDGTNVGRTERETVISTVNGGSNTAIRYTYRDKHRIGDFELRSTVPKRVYIDNGYIDINDNETYAYNYYVHDNQGSVRVVIGENGAIKQATDYSAYGVPSTRYEGTSTNNHLHLGLEWQSMKGLYGYYNNARFRDAILAGTFFQQDPLSEKYYPYTPYHYGAGNPLRYVDVSGGEPTPAEALRMSSHVYGDQSDDILIGGWSLSKNKTDILNQSYGLKSAVYERTLENGNKEYTYAFAGTQDATDILHDGLQLIGASGQYTQAIENLQALQENIGTAELTLTGHSLGGGLAALGSMKTGLKALTFNAAGVSSATKLFNGVNMIKPVESNIDAYILASDPLNLIQNIPLNLLPDVNGNINIIKPEDWNSLKNWHTIQNLINSLK